MHKPLKFLSIVPFPLFPLQSGGQNKTYGLLNELAKKHTVKVISPVPNIIEKKLPFTFLGNMLSPSFYRYINLFAFPSLLNQAKNCDVITIEQPFFGLMALFLKWIAKKPLVVHSHNIEYQRFKTLGTWWWKILKWFEGFVFEKVDVIFFISELDREEAIKQFRLPIDKCFISPYGVSFQRKKEIDKVYFKQKFEIPESHSVFLFFGKMDYLPNQYAVNNIQKYILPVLLNKGYTDFTVLICGKGLPKNIITEQESKYLKYVGFVDDIDSIIRNCDAMLNPVTSGGGVKTKVLEAIALHKTVVSTETGALGINPKVCGKKLLIASDTDWSDFTELCLQAKDNQKETRMEFFEKYSWEGIGKQYESDISNLF